MSSNSSQRIRKSFSDIPGMQQPDESPPRSLRGPRASTMPLAAQPQPDHPHPQQPSQSTAYAQRRSSPVPLTTSQSQHVPSPNSQNFATGHPQFHSHADQGPELSQVHATSQPTPPLNFPRPLQRVPPPPLLGPDARFNTIHDDWTMTGQLLAELGRAAHDQEASNPINLAGIGAGVAQSQHAVVPNLKGPIIESIERDRMREKKDSPRDSEGGGAAGSAGSVIGRSGSLRQSLVGSQPQQTQSKNESPPQTPPHTQTSHSQAQRPLHAVSERSPPSTSRPTDREQGSPTYYPPLTSHHADTLHYAQPQPQTQSRDSSPPFRYDERQQIGGPPSKTKTPDRSLPVQEENEAEEDVTITPSVERERARERERQRDQDLENAKERPRPMNHRLPTPQFSSSPMIPPDRIKSSEAPSDVELSSTIQGDDYHNDHAVYDNDRNGRSSRAGHRLDTEEARHQDKDETRRHTERSAIQQETEDQEETESYTPRSHHASLPQIISNSGGPSMERVVYNTSQFHFRPRTASSDAGGMVNLDAAVLHDAIEKLQDPYIPEQSHSHPGIRGAQRQQDFVGPSSPYTSPPLLGQHSTLPHLVPTPEDIRGIVHDSRTYEAWQRHMSSAHIRPGAPVPPTPPNPAVASLSYAPPPFSPPPPRSTPYPYSYQYQHLVHRSQDSQHILQHMQQQQLHQLQLLAATGMQTDSTFSPSSTPYPSYDYSPFLPEHFRRANGLDEASMSMRSSPSHMPVNLPIFTPSRRLQAKRQSLRRVRGSRELVHKLPPRGESTEPRETSPESSDGEEGDQAEYEEFHELAAQLGTGTAGTSSENAATEGRIGGNSDNAGAEDEGEWVDEDEDGEDDLLHLEYHPNFVVNPDKRRKRWELKWDALVKAFQALDRQTDSTLLLFAAPTHSNSLYSIRSRSLRRIPSLVKAPELEQIKSSFRTLSVQRRLSRVQTRHMSLAERFERYTSSTSSEGSETREEELKGALGAALSSLSALSSIYEGREQRWRTEMGRMGEERERVEVLLRQALGMGLGPGVP